MSEKEKPALTRRNSGSSKSAKGPPVLSRQCSIQSNQSDYSYATESEYDYDDYGDDMDGLSDVEEERGETPNKLLKVGTPASCQKGEVDYSQPYICSTENALEALEQSAADFCGICSLPVPVGLILLREGNFNNNHLVNKFLESSEQMLAQYNLSTTPSELKFGDDDSNDNMCFVCCNDGLKNEDYLSIGCDHFYCRDCWVQFFKDKIESGEVLAMRCMDPSCKIVPSTEVLQGVLGDTLSDVKTSFGDGEGDKNADAKDDKEDTDLKKSKEGGKEKEGEKDTAPAPPAGAVLKDQNKGSVGLSSSSTIPPVPPSSSSSSSSKEQSSSATNETAAEKEAAAVLEPEEPLKPLTLMDKYKGFLCNLCVERHSDYRFCPSSGCSKISFVPSNWPEDYVDCADCSFRFCYLCPSEAHAPAACKSVKSWELKAADDSMNSKWLQANTKICPECSSVIEKNGGCNHMTCRVCRHDFCWLCSGKWKGHTNCNSVPKDQLDQKSARAVLERYLHYWDRYNAHLQSQKFEADLLELCQKKANQIELGECVNDDEVEGKNEEESKKEKKEKKEKGEKAASSDDEEEEKAEKAKKGALEVDEDVPLALDAANAFRYPIDTDYLIKACYALNKCRRLLKFTYVHAFYIENQDEKDLFEFMQAELEKNTENLSYLLEHNADQRDNIMNQTGGAVRRLEKLLEGALSGVRHITFTDKMAQPQTTVPVSMSVSMSGLVESTADMSGLVDTDISGLVDPDTLAEHEAAMKSLNKK